jgi:hypothetical protein
MKKTFVILITLSVLPSGCSTMKLIEPLAQIKKIDSYSYRTVKTEPDLINTCIDYMTYAIGAIIIVPIVYTGICEYFTVHD